LAVMPSPYRQPGGGLPVSLRSGQGAGAHRGARLHPEQVLQQLALDGEVGPEWDEQEG